MDRQLIKHVETDGEGRQVITVSGVIDLRMAETFYDELSDVLASTGADVVIDLSEVEFLDSTGVTALMRSGKDLRSSNREMVLISTTGPVRRVLEVSGVDEVFRVMASLDEGDLEDS